ncbi:MAG TPA: SH3 domain-containing protein, partial [Saccharofermentans sp.]|nr:SH3 domain-containing protein [Saccharofermentans sp.]
MRNQKRTLKSFTIVLLLLCIISTLFLYAPNGRISADTTPNAKIINCNQYVNMRDSATDKANIVAQVPLGTRVTVTETVTAVAGDGSGSPTWYKIEVIISGVVKTGFVCGKFVQMDAGSVPIQDAAFEASIASFPESYKP